MAQQITFYPEPESPATDAFGRAVEPVSHVPDWVRLITEPERAVLERTAAGLMALVDDEPQPQPQAVGSAQPWPPAPVAYTYTPAAYLPHMQLALRRAHRRRYWFSGVAVAIVLGGMGAFAYACLFAVTGAEVFAAALIVGVLAGVGLRLGGRPSSRATSAVAVAISSGSLMVGAYVGDRVLQAMTYGGSLKPLIGDMWSNPVSGVTQFFAEPVMAAVTLGLAAAGAILTSTTFQLGRNGR